MRFVDDDRETLAPQAVDLLQHEGKGLQGDDEDLGGLACQRGADLLGLGPLALLADLGDHPGPMLELVDGVLELPVEYGAIGDHDDLVEDLLVVGGMQVRQPVGEPGDRVRLAGAGRVLHQVVVPRSVFGGVCDQAADSMPLVVAREDQVAGVGTRSTATPPYFALFQVHEAPDDVQPRLGLPDLLPQVGGAIPAGSRGRIARSAVFSGAVGAGVEG